MARALTILLIPEKLWFYIPSCLDYFAEGVDEGGYFYVICYFYTVWKSPLTQFAGFPFAVANRKDNELPLRKR